MKNKHVVMALLVGWAIAFVFPPQKLLMMFKGKGG